MERSHYPNNCLEKESSHILKMTILKDDNQTDKQDRTNRWITKKRGSQKKRYFGDTQSIPSREAPRTETSKWDQKPLTNKEDQKIKGDSCSTEKLIRSENQSQTEKRLKIEETPSKQSSEKPRISSEASQHSSKPSDTIGNHIGTMAGKFC